MLTPAEIDHPRSGLNNRSSNGKAARAATMGASAAGT